MTTQTKFDVITEFLQDLKLTIERINTGNDSQSDHNNLRDYFTMLGIKEDTVDGIYQGCGFKNSKEFLEDRKKSKQFQRGNVSCTISKINGLSEAVIEFLECEISKEKQKC